MDDASNASIFMKKNLPSPIVFDHPTILADYFRYKQNGCAREIFRYGAAGS
jgi:8-oxo-dGTP diphosphatase